MRAGAGGARSAWTRAALLVALAAALLAGCGADPGEPEVASPPHGAIEVEGETYSLGLGTNCWRADEDAAFLCVEAVGIITAPPYAETSAGATLTLAGELATAGIPIGTAQLWPAPDAPIEGGDGWEAWQPAEAAPVEPVVTAATVTLPGELEPGRYLLAINVDDPELGNSGTYGAIVEIR